jgi:nucleoside-diphosphate-sugar epimerase
MVFIGTGETDVGLCYVENLTTALLLASGSDIGLGRAYNVADGLGITWEHFVNRLARFLGQDVLRRRLPYKVAYAAAWVLERWAQILPQPCLPRECRSNSWAPHNAFPPYVFERSWGGNRESILRKVCVGLRCGCGPRRDL